MLSKRVYLDGGEYYLMFQVLDDYRIAYEKETYKRYVENPKTSSFVETPTWEYVCWLEDLLRKNKVNVLTSENSRVIATTTYAYFNGD